MLLVNNQSGNSLDVYQYKLILAIICSKHGFGKEFEYLVATDYEYIKSNYKRLTGVVPDSFMEVFYFYLSTQRNIKKAKELIYSTYDKLFSMNVRQIIPELLSTTHMDKKIHDILQALIERKIIDSDWQILKKHVLDTLKNEIQLLPKFYGKGSNFFQMLSTTLGYYKIRNNADIHAVLNKTGMNKLDENDFSASMLNVEVLPVQEEHLICFPEIMKNIYSLNEALYLHRINNTEPFYFYDLLTRYKRFYLDVYYSRLEKIFTCILKVKSSSYITIDEPCYLTNTGVKEKFRKHNALLNSLEAIVKQGLNPKDVYRYVKKIYLHVWNTSSGNASGLFTFKPISKRGNFDTNTTFSKISGHEKVKEVLEGLVALHNLFVYMATKNINIFDIPSEAFMYEQYLYRFETLEEAIELFSCVKDLIKRGEVPEAAKRYDENKLPFNDKVIKIVREETQFDLSISAPEVISYLGTLVDAGKNRKLRDKNKLNPIFEKFTRVLVVLTVAVNKFEELSSALTFGDMVLKIPYIPFIANLASGMDIVSALNLEALKNAGVKADFACVRGDDGYYRLPVKPFEYYCCDSQTIVNFISILHKQEISERDSILEVYRTSSFFDSMWQLFKCVHNDLIKIRSDFDPAVGMKMGFFDAYNFTYNHMLLCSLRSMKEIDAIKKITDNKGTNLFLTGKKSMKAIYVQLIGIYRLFVFQFKNTLALLEELADLYYYEFANKIGGGYSLTGNESILEAARQVVLEERCICTNERFIKYANSCSRTLYGFLKYQGSLVTKTYKGRKMILHEHGLWVGIADDGSFMQQVAIDKDFAEGDFISEFE